MSNLIVLNLFDKTIKFHAGIEQVCLLTKTKSINGLPKNIKDLAITEQVYYRIINFLDLKYIILNLGYFECAKFY